jgi:hypothetical protein
MPSATTGTVIVPQTGNAPSALVKLSNNSTGLQDLTVNALTSSGSSYGVQITGDYCYVFNVEIDGGSNTTLDSTGAAALSLLNIIVNTKAANSSVICLNVAGGSDWVVANSRFIYGTKNITAGGAIWTNVHFTGNSNGSANVIDNGGLVFTSCYFDSCSASANALIDRSGASHPSSYSGCRFYQNTASVSGIPLIAESSSIGAIFNSIFSLISQGSSSWSSLVANPLTTTLVSNITCDSSFTTSLYSGGSPGFSKSVVVSGTKQSDI